MKISFMPRVLPPGAFADVTWNNHELRRAFTQAFHVQEGEKIKEIVVLPHGIRAIFESDAQIG
jgi:hypothetical protein